MITRLRTRLSWTRLAMLSVAVIAAVGGLVIWLVFVHGSAQAAVKVVVRGSQVGRGAIRVELSGNGVAPVEFCTYVGDTSGRTDPNPCDLPDPHTLPDPRALFDPTLDPINVLFYGLTLSDIRTALQAAGWQDTPPPLAAPFGFAHCLAATLSAYAGPPKGMSSSASTVDEHNQWFKPDGGNCQSEFHVRLFPVNGVACGNDPCWVLAAAHHERALQLTDLVPPPDFYSHAPDDWESAQAEVLGAFPTKDYELPLLDLQNTNEGCWRAYPGENSCLKDDGRATLIRKKGAPGAPEPPTTPQCNPSPGSGPFSPPCAVPLCIPSPGSGPFSPPCAALPCIPSPDSGPLSPPCATPTRGPVCIPSPGSGPLSPPCFFPPPPPPPQPTACVPSPGSGPLSPPCVAPPPPPPPPPPPVCVPSPGSGPLSPPCVGPPPPPPPSQPTACVPSPGSGPLSPPCTTPPPPPTPRPTACIPSPGSGPLSPPCR